MVTTEISQKLYFQFHGICDRGYIPLTDTLILSFGNCLTIKIPNSSKLGLSQRHFHLMTFIWEEVCVLNFITLLGQVCTQTSRDESSNLSSKQSYSLLRDINCYSDFFFNCPKQLFVCCTLLGLLVSGFEAEGSFEGFT